jgi:hypothetical protein
MSEDKRPPIPAELKRRVLVEAGHRCAIPACRQVEIDIHHIVPWEKVRAHNYENLIALCPNCHRRAHRGEIDAKSLTLYKFNLRAAHDKFSQLEIDAILMLFKGGEGAYLPWQEFMMIFFNRAFEARYLGVMKSNHPGITMTSSQGGVDTSPRFLVLTDRGRAFVAELGLHEI